jgi:hypothetical protein
MVSKGQAEEDLAKLGGVNSLINVTNINSNPKFLYSAGMFNLQKNKRLDNQKQ